MRRLIALLALVLLATTWAAGQMTSLGPFWIPPPAAGLGSAAPSFTFWNDLNAANEANAYIVRIPRTGTLDSAEFKLGTVSNVPDNGFRVSFQNLSGDFPDGTQDQFRDVASGLTTNAWITTGLITSDGSDTGIKRSVTAGDYLAVVVEFVTFVTGDAVTFSGVSSAGNVHYAQPVGAQMYLAQRSSASAWSVSGSLYPPFALKYSDGTYAHVSGLWYPYVDLNTVTTFNSGSTPDERGLRFTVPVSTQLTGIWFRGDNLGALDVVLYDGSTALQTVAVDTAVDSAAGGLNFFVPVSPTTLSPGSTYRAVVKPTTTTNVTLYDFTVPTTAHLSAVEGGTTWYYTERTDAGAWTDTDTKRPWMGVLLAAVATGGGETAMPLLGRLQPRPVGDLESHRPASSR